MLSRSWGSGTRDLGPINDKPLHMFQASLLVCADEVSRLPAENCSPAV